MTIAELHRNFNIELDKLSISSYPSFLPEEKDYWLNKAYLVIVNQKYTGITKGGIGFEDGQKRISDLSELVKSHKDSSVQITTSPLSCAKQADFLYFVSGLLEYKIEGGGIVLSNVIPISHEDSYKFRRTRTNIPVINDPVMVQNTNGFEIFFEEEVVEAISSGRLSFTCTYIKKPETISISTPNSTLEIADHVHSEIVSLAAFMAIENIESSRLQSSAQLINIQE